MDLPRLEADDFAPTASTIEQEMDVCFSCEMRDTKQCHCGEQLRHERVAENFRAVGEDPLDLLLGKRH